MSSELTVANNITRFRSDEEAKRIENLAEEIGTVQDLRNSFSPILNVILMALDAPPVFMRTKAIRALGQIVTSDPTFLSAVRYYDRPKVSMLDLTLNSQTFVTALRAIFATILQQYVTPQLSSLGST
jgi:hypothetical protein